MQNTRLLLFLVVWSKNDTESLGSLVVYYQSLNSFVPHWPPTSIICSYLTNNQQIFDDRKCLRKIEDIELDVLVTFIALFESLKKKRRWHIVKCLIQKVV